MDCPGGRRPLMPLLAFIVASTLVLMDCPGGLAISRFNASFAMGFNPCFNGLSRRTGARARRDAGGDASTLVLMDCPGGPGPWRRRRRRPQASTLVLMDCPGGPLEAKRGQLGRRASTLVLMDCPGGPDQPVRYHVRGHASTLVLMDCPGGLAPSLQRSNNTSFNPCFKGLSRRTAVAERVRGPQHASTLVLMDCPGGHVPSLRGGVRHQASTLVLMDCRTKQFFRQLGGCNSYTMLSM